MLSNHARLHSKHVNVWQSLYDFYQQDSQLHDLVGGIERALALSADTSTLTASRTVNIRFLPQFATILKFHKTFVASNLFTPVRFRQYT